MFEYLQNCPGHDANNYTHFSYIELVFWMIIFSECIDLFFFATLFPPQASYCEEEKLTVNGFQTLKISMNRY